MTPTKQEMLLWTGALSLALTAVWGAAVLDGQIVMTQTGSASAFGGPAGKPMERGTGIVFGKTVGVGVGVRRARQKAHGPRHRDRVRQDRRVRNDATGRRRDRDSRRARRGSA